MAIIVKGGQPQVLVLIEGGAYSAVHPAEQIKGAAVATGKCAAVAMPLSLEKKNSAGRAPSENPSLHHPETAAGLGLKGTV